MTVSIWWIRRDLRLGDNQALAAALQRSRQVIPLWILDPALLDSPYCGEKRLAFLLDGLQALDKSLEERGSRLVIRRGRPLDVLKTIQAETGADAIFAEADHSPYAQRRDAKVAHRLPLQRLPGVAAHPPGSVRKANGEPYVSYSAFRRTWESLPSPQEDELLPAPEAIATPSEVESDQIPNDPRLPDGVSFLAGEAIARQRLERFISDQIYRYEDERNRLDIDGTSSLSPYLRFGMLSARVAIIAAQAARASAPDEEARASADSWLSELIWRDFFIHVLHYFPAVREKGYREKYRELAWEQDWEAFDAWRAGETGYPAVDAAMRQLAQTGWISNRARMIVASFLVKDLLLNWQWGERWFMQQLVDGDPAANNGNWQWIAGTGTEASPYFRIFNPDTQAEKHDPDGAYIRRWLPELANVPDEYIHRPAEMSAQLQKETGCQIGEDYPLPIVEHSSARERALTAYRKVR